MKVGHKVFFYHSNTKVPGIAAVCEVHIPLELRTLLILIWFSRQGNRISRTEYQHKEIILYSNNEDIKRDGIISS